jgi:hypothetical protein
MMFWTTRTTASLHSVQRGWTYPNPISRHSCLSLFVCVVSMCVFVSMLDLDAFVYCCCWCSFWYYFIYSCFLVFLMHCVVFAVLRCAVLCILQLNVSSQRYAVNTHLLHFDNFSFRFAGFATSTQSQCRRWKISHSHVNWQILRLDNHRRALRHMSCGDPFRSISSKPCLWLWLNYHLCPEVLKQLRGTVLIFMDKQTHEGSLFDRTIFERRYG